MNKAITDGLVLTPPLFENGLDVWSSQDGTPGSDTYQGATNAALVPADQDFSSCLELQKTQSTQRLRYMGETPILPGCYLQIKVRVKAISGNLPAVRIAGWAGASGGGHVNGLTETGPSTQLQSYGEVVEISAIVGVGARNGVDMVWGAQAVFGHFGLDLTGGNGGIIRVDDFEIEDVTGAFLRSMLDVVDVKDFGALGDGTTDDRAAFEAADAAANGRTILVSEGTFYLGSNVSLDSPVRFEGTLVMPTSAELSLRKNFDLPTYINAFGDEELAFKKAFQSLLNASDHSELDMGGRRVSVNEPIDLQAAVDNRASYAIRRVVRNGSLEAKESNSWDDGVVTAQATYAASSPNLLRDVTNISQIEVGSLVQGSGVGREVYVRSRNIGAGTLTLSQPLYDAVGTQNYTFRRFRYICDFLQFDSFSRFTFADVDFLCNGRASAVMLARDGINMQFRDCYFTKAKDRAITSVGEGCQGIAIDNCQFLSNEAATRSQDRTSIGFNVNANDAKIRGNRMVLYGAFGVLDGTGHMLVGNHWFHGDAEPNGIRQAGLVFTRPNPMSIVTGNYIDNAFIELTNEHDATPNFSNQFSFGGLSLTGNIMTCKGVAPWFRWIVIKPFGTGHFVHGLSVTGNTFRAINGNVGRVETVDDSIAPLDMSRARNIIFEGNTFHAIDQFVANPVTLDFNQSTNATTWVCDFAGWLPFDGRARNATSMTKDGAIRNASNVLVDSMPHFLLEQGSNDDRIHAIWPQACSGRIHLTARMDNPN